MSYKQVRGACPRLRPVSCRRSTIGPSPRLVTAAGTSDGQAMARRGRARSGSPYPFSSRRGDSIQQAAIRQVRADKCQITARLTRLCGSIVRSDQNALISRSVYSPQTAASAASPERSCPRVAKSHQDSLRNRALVRESLAAHNPQGVRLEGVATSVGCSQSRLIPWATGNAIRRAGSREMIQLSFVSCYTFYASGLISLWDNRVSTGGTKTGVRRSLT